MNVSFKCGDAAFVIDGLVLYVNGEWCAEFMWEGYAERFAKALDAYGEAMYAEGYVAAGMEAL